MVFFNILKIFYYLFFFYVFFFIKYILNYIYSSYNFSLNFYIFIKKYRQFFIFKNILKKKSLFKLFYYKQGIYGIKNNKINLLIDYNDIINIIIHDINCAKNNIEIIFYIWQIGGGIDKICEALISASIRGVYCRLMLDAIGSIKFFCSSYFILMQNAGIHILKVMSINFLSIFLHRIDSRQHRKMILIDNYVAYIGSMNMVDPFFFKKLISIGQWIDIMIRLIGPIVIIMNIIFSLDWDMETGEQIFLLPYDFNIKTFNKFSNHILQIVVSGPGFSDNLIHKSFLISIYSTRERLVIATPYFIPSKNILYAICSLAQRNIEVHIIIPLYNDSLLVYWASRWFFSYLLNAGVFIYQFKGGLLHTKSMLIDNELSLVGTANLDMRSFWLNSEIVLIIDNINVNKELFIIHKNYMINSNIVNNNIWLQRPCWHRILEFLFSLLSPFL